MTVNPRKYLVTLAMALMLAGPPAWAQEAPDTVKSYPGITVKTDVDRAEVYIGDLINYTVTIIYDSTYELIPPPLGANLGAFDVKDYQTDMISRLDDGRLQSKNVFTLSTFTTGEYIIPPIPVIFNLPDGSQKALVSEGVPIKVMSLLEFAGDSVDIKPLKAQYEFERGINMNHILLGVGIWLVTMIALVIWLINRRRKRQAEAIDLRPAWEIAFEKLAHLKQKNLPAEGAFKLFYVELTDIIRQYFARMYDINAMDMTTGEFMEAFGEKDLPDGLLESMEKFFAHTDLVKFAKFVPELQRTEEDFEAVHAAVEEVRADWERRFLPEMKTEIDHSPKEEVV